ncbi:Uncharacterised protein [Vibrio cholerae]|nr:Uncharacterised protein [Vibrio cholerae]
MVVLHSFTAKITQLSAHSLKVRSPWRAVYSGVIECLFWMPNQFGQRTRYVPKRYGTIFSNHRRLK